MGATSVADVSDASARIIAATCRKREGAALDPVEIEELIGDFVSARTPDYQMAAWLATVDPPK